MRVCHIYVGHRRTFWYTEKNHKESLFPIHYIHHRDENSPSFNYHKIQDSHLYHSFLDGDTNIQNVLNSWHNRYLAFTTAPEGFDVYVLMRYDTFIEGKIDFRDFSYDDNTIIIPSDNDHRGGVNDQMVFGNREVIKKYVSIHTNHLHLFNNREQMPYPWFHNESYCTYNLQMQNVSIVRSPVETKICYDRTNIPPHVMDKIGKGLIFV